LKNNYFWSHKLSFCIFLIIAWAVIRFVGLEQSPPGFYADEARGAAHVMCLQEWGHDAAGVSYPLFADGGEGYYSPIHIYSAYIWTAIFGHSISAFRAMSAFVTTLTIIGLWFLANQLFGKSAALMTVLAATMSPWAFSVSRIAADDPTLFPMGMVWGIYFLIRGTKIWDAMLAGLLFSVAMYSYPPARAVIPLLFIIIFWYQGFSRQTFTLLFMAVVVAVTTGLPWILPILNGDMQRRMNAVGIFSAKYMDHHHIESIFGIIPVFLKNLLLHMSPVFLFWSGDANLRHSTQFTGELGWVDILAVGMGIIFLIKSRVKKPWDRRLIFCLLGFLIGLVPAALTWERIPHALRSVGAWPFISLVSGYLLAIALERWAQFKNTLVIVSLVYSVLFFWNYFETYPKLSKNVWDTPVKEIAILAKEQNAWPEFLEITKTYPYMATRYFLMYYGGMTCKDTYPK